MSCTVCSVLFIFLINFLTRLLLHRFTNIRWARVLPSLLLLICSCLLICSWKIAHEHPMSIFHIWSKYEWVKNNYFSIRVRFFGNFDSKKWNFMPIVNSVQTSEEIYGFFLENFVGKRSKIQCSWPFFGQKTYSYKKFACFRCSCSLLLENYL